jgi:hypothetical protein
VIVLGFYRLADAFALQVRRSIKREPHPLVLRPYLLCKDRAFYPLVKGHILSPLSPPGSNPSVEVAASPLDASRKMPRSRPSPSAFMCRPASADFCANFNRPAQGSRQDALLPPVQFQRVADNPNNSRSGVCVHHPVNQFSVQKNITGATAIVCGVNVLSLSHSPPSVSTANSANECRTKNPSHSTVSLMSNAANGTGLFFASGPLKKRRHFVACRQ